MDDGLGQVNANAAYLRRLVPMALRMHEKAIRKGLIREEELPDETPIERYRRLTLGRVAAETILATQVKVDEASLRRRDSGVMARLVKLVAEAEEEEGV